MMLFTTRIHEFQNIESVPSVLTWCYPFKVFGSVVGVFAIFVVALVSIWSWAMESGAYQTGNFYRVMVQWRSAKRYSSVASTHSATAKNSPHFGPMAFGHVANPPKIRNLIKSFVIVDRHPLLGFDRIDFSHDLSFREKDDLGQEGPAASTACPSVL